MKRIRILLADDHAVVRQGFKMILAEQPDMEIVGEAGNGREAVELAEQLRPDIVVMDVAMPELNGIEATRRIASGVPHARVVALSMHKDSVYVREILRAGARGYLLKDADQDEIVSAIRAVGRGEAIFGPAIASRVIDYFAAPRPSLPPQAFPELTARERELLELIAQGHNNQAIAERLGLRHKTVRNHVSNIFSKLQVADRAQAIVRARQAGLGTTRARPE
jgi:DNA-binding NarL/FixJ family response regulator